MSARLAALAAALLAGLAPAAAPSTQPAAAESPTLEWLVGTWRGEGERAGRTLEAVLEVRPALGGRFLEFRYRSGSFEGRAFYRPAESGRWLGQWFDNRGMSFPIDAIASGRTLASDWGSPDSEQGRTVYAMGSDGGLEITDSIAAPDGTRRIFATHRLQRLP